MASIIKIKRSGLTAAPSGLGQGELAYSWFNNTNKLYIGTGTETDGIAANIEVIGGKFFTDMLDHTPGTLTASSALIVDANSKIDIFNVDNLRLDGNTLSSTNTNGDINITPNGAGKTIITNPYIGDSSTSLLEFIQDATGGSLVEGLGIDLVFDDNAGTTTISAELASSSNAGIASFDSTDFSVTGSGENLVTLNIERVQDIVGGMVSSNTENGISVTYDDNTGKLNFDVNDPTITIAGDADGSATMTNLGNTTITVTLDTVNTNVGSFGSSSQVPVITVNGKGLVTAVSTAAISTSFTLAADTGTADTFNNGETLTFTGGEGIDTAVTNNTITISAEDATTTNKGVASFNTSDFNVTAGAVELKDTVVKSISAGTDTVTPSGHAFTITGTAPISTSASGSTLTIAAADATTSSKGVASFSADNFAVSSGVVTIKDGGIANVELVNSTVTVGSTTIALGATSTSLAGLTELTVDNLNFNSNTISATNTDGDVVLDPNGTGTVNVSGSRITGVATPVNDNDAANKAYVDNSITGLTWKNSVHLLASTNVTLTGSTATLVIDGHAALDSSDVGYRILLLGQNTASQNGIYVYADNGTSYTLTRSTDADTYQELIGAAVFVKEGTAYANTGWVQTEHYLTDFTGQEWVQFSGAGAYTAGDGLTQSGTIFNVGAGDGISVGADTVSLASTVAGDGLTYTSGVINAVGTANRIIINANSIDIASTYAGQSTITTVGTIGSGTWQGTIVSPTYGGTGINNGTKTITLGGNLTTSGAFATTLTVTGTTNVTLPTTGTLATLAGTESLSNKTITASSFAGSVAASTLSASGLVTLTNTTDATALGTAAVVLSGGLSVAKQIRTGSNITGNGTSSTIDGFIIDGGTY